MSRRIQILRRATEVFERQGVNRTSIEDIANAVGIKRENLDEIARRSLSYQPVQLNPRPIKTVEDVKEILEIAW